MLITASERYVAQHAAEGSSRHDLAPCSSLPAGEEPELMTHREEILELQSVRDEHAARLSGSKPEESAGPSAWHATTSSRPSSAGVRPGSARSRPSSAGVRPGSARSVRSDFGRPCSVRSRPGSARSVRSEELAVARTSQLLETEESRASRAERELLILFHTP